MHSCFFAASLLELEQFIVHFQVLSKHQSGSVPRVMSEDSRGDYDTEILRIK